MKVIHGGAQEDLTSGAKANSVQRSLERQGLESSRGRSQDSGHSPWSWVMVSAVFAAIVLLSSNFMLSTAANADYEAELPSIDAAKAAFSGRDDATCKVLSREAVKTTWDYNWKVNLSCDKSSSYAGNSFHIYIKDWSTFDGVKVGGLYNVHVHDWRRKPNLPEFTMSPR